ncbi:MAG: hypothetical protein KJ814_08840 [Proteobacteria bacterium]|nr:hypothetical protein [Pseudomonadota bacterium]
MNPEVSREIRFSRLMRTSLSSTYLLFDIQFSNEVRITMRNREDNVSSIYDIAEAMSRKARVSARSVYAVLSEVA